VIGEALAQRASLGLGAPDSADRWATTWEGHATDRPPAFPADLT